MRGIGYMETTKIANMQPIDLRHLTWTKTSGSLGIDGVFLKAEQVVGGVKHYYKLSNYDDVQGVYGHEAVNELIAYRLGKSLGFNVAEGTLRRCLVSVDGRGFETFAYISKSFKTAGSRESFDTFYDAKRLCGEDGTPEAKLDFCIRHGWADEVYKMFIFDYLIVNRDRHGANLEVLKNGETRLSPLFDTGVSFVFSFYVGDNRELSAFDELEDVQANNYIGTRSLRKNLGFIDRNVRMSDLDPALESSLFAGLEGVLPDRYYEKIWRIIAKRWEYVKGFRLV
jgi:hypothetical protein